MVAVYQGWGGARCREVLANKTQAHNDWWCCSQGKMNNCTLYFVQAHSRAVTQWSHGHWENVTSYGRVFILGQYKCWYRADSETMCHMLKAPMHPATGNSTTLWNTIQAMGSSGHWCILWLIMKPFCAL